MSPRDPVAYTVGLDEHRCNAWCSPPQHAHLALVSPTQDAESIVHGPIAHAYYALHRRRIIAARQAPEADKARLVTEKVGHYGVSTRLNVRKFDRDMLATLTCWLITFVAEED